MNQCHLKSLWIATDEQGNCVKDPTNKSILTDREEIHEALLRRNADHLGQASATPFAKGSFRKKLLWDGTGPLAEDILNGNLLNQKKYSAALQLYLESIRVKDLRKLNIVRPHLHLEDYKSF